ncbi:hypothetical protein [Amycolatopsis palatopharyngis]|uniref:hypothetical protein n=1 Tax=Amycolatopsis palatopharyngis TaxID=187982 RepID=UPI000E2590E7|nr:hypothetical protein [Amycolatopsis palatopharyngis]
MAEASGFWAGATATEQVQNVFGGAVGGIAAGATLGPAGDASWEFDPDEIDSVISKWEALRDDCLDDRLMLEDIASAVTPPSQDEPSNQFVGLLGDGLNSLRASNESILAYIDDFLGKLKAAKSQIESAESDNESPFKTVGKLFDA